MTDTCAAQHTWLGATGAKSLSDKKIIRAIYESMLRSRQFPRPAEREFEKQVKQALKSAKERCRKCTATCSRPTSSAELQEKKPLAEHHRQQRQRHGFRYQRCDGARRTRDHGA